MALYPYTLQPIDLNLTEDEFRQLVEFLRYGLLDPRARPERLNRGSDGGAGRPLPARATGRHPHAEHGGPSGLPGCLGAP